MKEITIGIADDHQLFRDGVRTLLDQESDMQVAWVAGDGEMALQCAKNQSVDLLLLDINMPGKTGIELLPLFKSQQPDIRIIMLSMHEDPAKIFRCIREGANSYLTKDTNPLELVAAIREVVKKGVYFNDKASQAISSGLNGLDEKEKKNPFSELELQVLSLICAGQTNAEIAAEIFRSPRTVEGYRQRLLEKSQCRNTADLVAYAIRNNLVE